MFTMPFGFFASGGLPTANITLIDTNYKHANVTLTRASVAWYLDASQILTQVANNVERYEYSGTGVYQGLLVEGSATSRRNASDPILTNYTIRTGISSASPLASYFSNSVQFAASPASLRFAATAGAAPSSGTTNIYSVFVRMDDDSMPVVGTNSTTGDFAISCNGSGGTPNLTSNPATVEYYGGGVYRVSVSVVHSAAYYGIAQYPTQSGKGFRITGLNLTDIVQVPKVNSYIVTSGATIRAADIVSTTLATIGISAVAGTLFIEHTAANGTALFSSGANAILSSQGAGKIAIAYDASGVSICHNGGAVTTGSALTFSTVLRIAMSTASIATTCHIKKCTWHNTKLSASDLQTLTT